VGDAGISYQHAYLQTVERYAHLSPGSVKEINVGANLVPALVSGRVDAILGGYWNYEAIQLAQLGRHPSVIHMNQVGVPPYDELVLVTRAGLLEQQPALMRRFVQAVARGYESVRSDPAGAVANLVRLNPALNQRLQLASVRATLPAFFPRQASQPWGWQSQAQWNAYGRWMLSHHLITNVNAVVAASTNELLAGQGI
jgi:putative hydroxymethylpyrimidine transport system substrate-binding protein